MQHKTVSFKHLIEIMDTIIQETTPHLSNEAILSSGNGYTIFQFGGYNVRFKAPYSLERYLDVKEWDNGYLVVLAKYKHSDEPQEEYIDLAPILEDLYIDKTEFLQPIQKVTINYAQHQTYC